MTRPPVNASDAALTAMGRATRRMLDLQSFENQALSANPAGGPIFHTRITDAVAARLGGEILGGTYQPGQYLPTEMESCVAFDMSRSAYREVMRILAAKGFVEARPKTGTRVNARDRWNILDPDVLRWMFESEPNEQFIESLFELRLISEPPAAELSAQRRSQEDLEIMRQAIMVMRRETLWSDLGRRADLIFHRRLISSTGNMVLISLGNSIEAAVTWSTRYKARTYKLIRDPVPDHETVFDAIEARDAGAARWGMSNLILNAQKDTSTERTVAGR